MRLKQLLLFGIATALLLFSSCKKEEPSQKETISQELTDILNEASNGQGTDVFRLPFSDQFHNIPQDPKNPLTEEKVELGKLLFHETAISINPMRPGSEGTYSCASCHHADAGFQAGIRQGIAEGGIGFGIQGEGRIADPNFLDEELDIQPVRTPSAMNIAYQECILWNGMLGATGINENTEDLWTEETPKEFNFLGYQGTETQAIAGMKVHRMEIDIDFIESTSYKAMYDQVFSDFPLEERYTKLTTGLAVAAYERTLLSNQAPFQRWLRGSEDEMTVSQMQGAKIFFGKGNCVSCHNGPALSSMEFHALGMNDLDGIGVYGEGILDFAINNGRASFTNKDEDMYKFKVPQLYNLADSPFFGHGGNFNSIEEVVRYKNTGIPQNSEVDPHQLAPGFVPLGLNEEEIMQLTDFLSNALRDPDLDRYVPASLPSGFCFPNNDPQSKLDLGCN